MGRATVGVRNTRVYVSTLGVRGSWSSVFPSRPRPRSRQTSRRDLGARNAVRVYVPPKRFRRTTPRRLSRPQSEPLDGSSERSPSSPPPKEVSCGLPSTDPPHPKARGKGRVTSNTNFLLFKLNRGDPQPPSPAHWTERQGHGGPVGVRVYRRREGRRHPGPTCPGPGTGEPGVDLRLCRFLVRHRRITPAPPPTSSGPRPGVPRSTPVLLVYSKLPFREEPRRRVVDLRFPRVGLVDPRVSWDSITSPTHPGLKSRVLGGWLSGVRPRWSEGYGH